MECLANVMPGCGRPPLLEISWPVITTTASSRRSLTVCREHVQPAVGAHVSSPESDGGIRGAHRRHTACTRAVTRKDHSATWIGDGTSRRHRTSRSWLSVPCRRSRASPLGLGGSTNLIRQPTVGALCDPASTWCGLRWPRVRSSDGRRNLCFPAQRSLQGLVVSAVLRENPACATHYVTSHAPRLTSRPTPGTSMRWP